MREEQTMALICFSGLNEAESETHVQICLGTEGGASTAKEPYFFTITIANGNVPKSDAQRRQIPLSRKDMKNLRRWIDQVLPTDDDGL
ncbi:MAG: hypothetical protein AAF799_43125 [Myxococcota bacterium]